MKFFQQISLQCVHIVYWLFLALAAYFIYLPPFLGSAIPISPDSSEYTIGLVNLFDHGTFGITLNGVWYPSRYTPWFSLSCLAPVYLLSGGNPQCFHWAILVFSLVVLMTMVKWGERIGLRHWSLSSAVLLLFFPDFVFYGRIVMTEIPYTALFAVSALVWLRFIEKGENLSLKCCFGVGALVAWGGMVRPTMLPMLTPFAFVILIRSSRRKWLPRVGMLVCPSLIYEAVNLLRNKLVFGSVFRSGYQYWQPVPCDFPNLMFSWANACLNVGNLLCETVVRATLVMLLFSFLFAVLVLRGYYGGLKKNKRFILLFGYLCFQFLALLALYVSYYWTDTRFYLSVSICVIPLFLYACLRMIVEISRSLSPLLFGLVIVFSGMLFIGARPIYRGQPHWRQVWLTKGKIASRVLPANSVVMQVGDPNVLDHFCFRRQGIDIFPYQRWSDYVKYMAAPISIRNYCNPANVCDWYIPELVRRGVCKSPFPLTFEEEPRQIEKFLAEGRRVFLEQSALDGEMNGEKFIANEDALFHDKAALDMKVTGKVFKDKLKQMGLVAKYYGEWTEPGIVPNPIRHVYDEFVLADCRMDSRPETSAVFYEIVREEGGAR